MNARELVFIGDFLGLRGWKLGVRARMKGVSPVLGRKIDKDDVFEGGVGGRGVAPMGGMPGVGALSLSESEPGVRKKRIVEYRAQHLRPSPNTHEIH